MASAQLSIYIHPGLLRRFDGNMGGSTDVSSPGHVMNRELAITLWPSVSFFGLIDGGFAGLIWCYVAVFVGFIFVYASMAELASMYDFFGFLPYATSSSQESGLPHQAVNTTGFLNLLRENTRGS